jgi:hypothetical protein
MVEKPEVAPVYAMEVCGHLRPPAALLPEKNPGGPPEPVWMVLEKRKTLALLGFF